MKLLRTGWRRAVFVVGTLLLGAPCIASAHEAYVVPRDYFWEQAKQPWSPHAFEALSNPHNQLVMAEITLGVLLLLIMNAIFRRSRPGQRFHRAFERFAFIGPFLIRVTVAIALFCSAWSGNFLGPEIPLSTLPFPELMRAALYAVSFMTALGFGTELAAIVMLSMFGIAMSVYGAYLLTYLNYFGEMLVLMLFGMRTWSVDGLVFGQTKRLANWKKYETAIVRLCYGFALMFAGVTVKMLHPDLTVHVVEVWHLTQFHWLFPRDPLLVTFGAGLAEFFVGLFIFIGFEMRLTVLISLFYITLSLLYFRELVWPHLLLYGISLNLLVQPETFTVDAVLFPNQLTKKRGS